MVFGQRQQETSTMSTTAAMVTPKSKCLFMKKSLKFPDGDYHLKVQFMLYKDFEIILKPVHEHYREKNESNEGRTTR